MTEADVQRLLAEKKIRGVAPGSETARAEIGVARRHIASAETIMAADPTLAFTGSTTLSARRSQRTCARTDTA